jgi:hypothetical protein
MTIHNFPMKVLVRAGLLPDGALVTKRTGTSQFRIRRRMRFYTNGGADESQRQTITPKDGCVILVEVNNGDRGNDAVNIYPSTTEFMWLVDSEELEDWLREKHEPACK